MPRAARAAWRAHCAPRAVARAASGAPPEKVWARSVEEDAELFPAERAAFIEYLTHEADEMDTVYRMIRVVFLVQGELMHFDVLVLLIQKAGGIFGHLRLARGIFDRCLRDDYWSEMGEHERSVLFGTMLDVYVSRGDYASAQEVAGLMRARAVEPDVETEAILRDLELLAPADD